MSRVQADSPHVIGARHGEAVDADLNYSRSREAAVGLLAKAVRELRPRGVPILIVIETERDQHRRERRH